MGPRGPCGIKRSSQKYSSVSLIASVGLWNNHWNSVQQIRATEAGRSEKVSRAAPMTSGTPRRASPQSAALSQRGHEAGLTRRGVTAAVTCRSRCRCGGISCTSQDGWKDADRKKISWLLPRPSGETTLTQPADIALKDHGGKRAQTSAKRFSRHSSSAYFAVNI